MVDRIAVQVQDFAGNTISRAAVRVGGVAASFHQESQKFSSSEGLATSARTLIEVTFADKRFWDFSGNVELNDASTAAWVVAMASDDAGKWLSASHGPLQITSSGDGSSELSVTIYVFVLKPARAAFDSALSSLPRESTMPTGLAMAVPLSAMPSLPSTMGGASIDLHVADSPFTLSHNAYPPDWGFYQTDAALAAPGGDYNVFSSASDELMIFVWIPSVVRFEPLHDPGSPDTRHPVNYHLMFLPDTLARTAFPVGEDWFAVWLAYTNWDPRYYRDFPKPKYSLSQIAMSRRNVCFILPLAKPGRSYSRVFGNHALDCAVAEINVLLQRFASPSVVFPARVGRLSAGFFSDAVNELRVVTHPGSNPTTCARVKEIYLFEPAIVDMNRYIRRLASWYLADRDSPLEGSRRLRVYTRHPAMWGLQDAISQKGIPLEQNIDGHWFSGENIVSEGWREYHNTHGSIVVAGDRKLGEVNLLQQMYRAREAVYPVWPHWYVNHHFMPYFFFYHALSLSGFARTP